MTAVRSFSRLGAFATVLVLCASPGCIKVKSTMVLNKDGSGTVSETSTTDMTLVKALGEKLGAMMGGDKPAGEQPGGAPAEDPMKEFDDDTNPDAIKKKLEGKKGVELVSATRTDDSEKKTRTAEKKLKFTTLEDYFRAGLEKSADVQLEQIEGGAWKLTRKSAEEPGGAEMLEAMKPMLEPFLKDMEMSMQLELPGTIVETNGTKSETGNVVTWKLTWADVGDLKKSTGTVVFKGEGLALKPFHLRTDKDGVTKDVKAAAEGEGAKEGPKEAPKEAPVEEPAPK